MEKPVAAKSSQAKPRVLVPHPKAKPVAAKLPQAKPAAPSDAQAPAKYSNAKYDLLTRTTTALQTAHNNIARVSALRGAFHGTA